MEASLSVEGGEYFGEEEGGEEVDCYCDDKEEDGVVGQYIIAFIIIGPERVKSASIGLDDAEGDSGE